MKLRRALSIAALVGTSLAGAAHADVINHADVGSFTTFEDTNTGRVWLDLNNFFNQTPDSMIAAATSAGFTFATETDLHDLLVTLPLTGGQWASYSAIMGSAPDRPIIWGTFDDGGDPFGYASAYDGEVEWMRAGDIAPGNVIQNANTPAADMNIWAFQDVAVPTGVPEPITLSLFSAGLLGAVAMRRHKAKRA